ncbi:MAG: hypothetical protein FJY19_06855 [Bacteroidetes bacterium]|nr:hypothetical protein [Bacteroidota bacterium]
MRYNNRLFLFLALVFMAGFTQAQPIGDPALISDQHLLRLFDAGKENGLSVSAFELKARELGFTPAQLPALKKRLEQLSAKRISEGVEVEDNDKRQYQNKTRRLVSKKDSTGALPIFGADLFEQELLSFEPDLNIATPQNYLIGAGDQLVVDVFGVSDITKKLMVSPEGTIRYPNLGPITVGGLSIELATAKIKKSLSAIYPGIHSGAVRVQVSLGQIRSISVTLIGEVNRPGSVTISSLSTLMNALYLSGGPTAIGSLRSIELVRNGKKLVNFDLYDFLFRGDLSKNLLLQDGDVIRVGYCQTRVALKGAFNKPALYEATATESAKDLIDYAGGISPVGVKDFVSVIRLGKTRKEAYSLTPGQWSNFKLSSGDTLMVDSLQAKFINRVQVTGAVERPGIYGAAETKNLHQLLTIAVPREDAYLAHAVIRRVNTIGESSLQSFNVEQVLKGATDLILQSEDSVHIYTKSAIRETYTVAINGEINKPGKYNFLDKMNAMDLVLMAGGFSEGASRAQVEISRRLRNTTQQSDTMKYAVIKTINLDQDHSASLVESTLEPFDIVSVRRSPLYKTQLRVNLEGEVLYPGTYVLAGKQERLSDLIKRAGGLRDMAYPQGATLLRTTYSQNFISDTLLVEAKNQIAQKNKSTANAEPLQSAEILEEKYDQDSLLTEIKKRFLKPVGIQLDQALSNPGSRDDIYLEEGDVLRIPRQLQTVQTLGAVNVPKQIVYYPGLNYRTVIRQSGGYAANAYRKKGYAVYANGQVSNARKFLFFRSNPVISPGAEIYIPLKPERKGISTGEAVGIVSGLASVLGFLVIILRQ